MRPDTKSTSIQGVIQFYFTFPTAVQVKIRQSRTQTKSKSPRIKGGNSGGRSHSRRLDSTGVWRQERFRRSIPIHVHLYPACENCHGNFCIHQRPFSIALSQHRLFRLQSPELVDLLRCAVLLRISRTRPIFARFPLWLVKSPTCSLWGRGRQFSWSGGRLPKHSVSLL